MHASLHSLQVVDISPILPKIVLSYSFVSSKKGKLKIFGLTESLTVFRFAFTIVQASTSKILKSLVRFQWFASESWKLRRLIL